jgi:CheY-like chemotaxis protein
MPGRILIVDDDPWILRMVSALLDKRGYDIVTASDGEEGLKKATQIRPDLLITDVMMPKMDGWELVRALRARADLAFTPVLFLTALSGEDDRIRGFRLGADDYLPKPFRFEELDLRVQKVLERNGAIHAKLAEAAKAPVSTRSIPALRGSLDQLGLSSLLVMMEMERKSGVLQLERPGVIGRLFVRDGRVVAARLEGPHAPDDARTGAETVYHVLTWSDGDFEFSAVEVLMEDEMQTSTTHLLMEAARLMDELRR